MSNEFDYGLRVGPGLEETEEGSPAGAPDEDGTVQEGEDPEAAEVAPAEESEESEEPVESEDTATAEEAPDPEPTPPRESSGL